MKTILCVLLCCSVLLTCSKKFDVVLSLTNPQDIPVAFTGYYWDPVSADSVPLDGTTPREYDFVMEKGDEISGIVHKDGPNTEDTLHFQIFVDGEERITQKVTIPSQMIQFQLTAQ